jgi:hypothetical protein
MSGTGGTIFVRPFEGHTGGKSIWNGKKLSDSIKILVEKSREQFKTNPPTKILCQSVHDAKTEYMLTLWGN